MTRSDASWCGEAEFGPEPDDRELGAVVALREQAVAHLAGDVGLRAPDEAAVGNLVDDAVGGLGGEPQQGDLVDILHDPQVAQHERRRLEHDVRESGLQPQQVNCPQAVGDAEAGEHAGEKVAHAADRVLGLLPCGERHGATGRGRAGPRAGAASSRGTTRVTGPSAGTTSIVSRSSGIAG